MTIHLANIYLLNVLSDLKQDCDILLKWLTENILKANPEKYHLLFSIEKK